MNALITGASGFIGAHLASALLARGNKVRCLVRPSSRTERLQTLDVEIVAGDVRDLPSLRRATTDIDAVFHLAGLVKGLSLAQLLTVNEQGSRNVAQACAEQPRPPILVSASSLAAAGPSRNGRPRVETDTPQPVSNYGRSKHAGEVAVAAYADRVPLTIVRPPVVFGEGDPAMVPLFRPIKWMRLHCVPGFSVRRASMLHAADLVIGLIAAAERGERVTGVADVDTGRGVYYFASERAPTLGEWGAMIARALDRRVLVVHMPAFVGWGAAYGSDMVARLRGQAQIFSRDKMRELTAGSWVCDAGRAQANLGFSVGADLETRLAQTAAWYLQERWI